MDAEGLQTFIVIYGIVGFITLIVFFVMASNIAKIRKELNSIRKEIAPEKQEHIRLGERAAFVGDNKEAIRHYQNMRWDIKKWIDLQRPPQMYKDLEVRAKKRIDQL